jgi:iron complex transport system substrate-binding protein
MRIVSLLPSATEILFALGLEREIVGVSHECDFPLQARAKTIVIHSRIPKDATPLEIDAMVRDFTGRGESVYTVDAGILADLAPDLIVTQDLCHVCAASPDDLAVILTQFEKRVSVLCLNPMDLGDIWRDILWVGEETARGFEAEDLVQKIGARLSDLEQQLLNIRERPRVVFLEWLQPFYVGGHWVPEMIEMAGGEDVLGRVRSPSYRVTAEDVIDAAPEILIVAPCGYSAEQSREEYRGMHFPEAWGAIPAVRNNRVYALEANSYFSRPGPRVVTGVEILAKLLHPEVSVSAEVERAILDIGCAAPAARAASV